MPTPLLRHRGAEGNLPKPEVPDLALQRCGDGLRSQVESLGRWQSAGTSAEGPPLSHRMPGLLMSCRRAQSLLFVNPPSHRWRGACPITNWGSSTASLAPPPAADRRPEVGIPDDHRRTTKRPHRCGRDVRSRADFSTQPGPAPNARPALRPPATDAPHASIGCVPVS